MAGWINTVSGERIYIRPEGRNNYWIEDIAHALSLICRFGGNIDQFYSVAEHSVIASYKVPQKGYHPIQALMHDAAEAFLGDVITPLKYLLPDYRDIERDLLFDILEHYKIPKLIHPIVKQVDRNLAATEARDLIKKHHKEWVFPEGIYDPYSDLHIHNPMDPYTAKQTFLMRWAQIQENMRIVREDPFAGR